MASLPPDLPRVHAPATAGTPADAPDGAPPDGSRGGLTGPPPQVVGRDDIKARAFARLFGAPDGNDDDAMPPPAAATLGRNADDDAAPTQIGRFRVLERKGGGGMGVVWAAWDPELARRVAIKVLRADLDGPAGSVGHARLLREAQAMARISHPHVIAVHEVGSLGQQVFIAMELVEGTTLAGWLGAAPRPWRGILDAFLAAGDGIAAAHAAGVVHRDFKPDNVLVGDDGRVRVVDFGLARSGGAAPPMAPVATHDPDAADPDAADPDAADPDAADPDAADPDAADAPLTRTGAMMGTPAYMSPEQWRGEAADARSDQFSFCVALFEALHGRRPFRATTLVELARAVTSGQADVDAADARIPRFIDRALRRGLAREPDARYATMTELLGALRRDPAVRWRRVGIASAVAVIASAATFLIADGDPAGRCDGVGERLAGIWDPPVQQRVHDALLATDTPFAARTWESTQRLLDGYAEGWIAAAAESCAASMAATGGDDPRRERCLDARTAELRALTELLAGADVGIALQAVDAAARLPDPRECADPRRLAAYREIADAAARDRAAEARATLGRASAAGAVGRYAEATAKADTVVRDAGELDDPALEAAALLIRGQNEIAAGHLAAGEASLRRAVKQAELADDHATRAQALTHLVFVAGQDAARFAEARALGADAGAVLRVIGADPLLRAQLDGALGVAAKRGGQPELALSHHREAQATTRSMYGDDHPATLRATANLAIALRALDRDEEAERLLTEATAGLERVLGEHHPAVSTSLSNLAITVAKRNRPDQAVALMRRSLAIRERTDPGHPSIATGHFNLARALYDSRAYAEAKTQYREALDLRMAAAADDPLLAMSWAGIGRCALRLDELDVARDAFEHQLARLEATDDAAANEARIDLARTLLVHDPVRADALLDRVARGLEDRASTAGPPTREVRAQLATVSMLADSILLARDVAAGRR